MNPAATPGGTVRTRRPRTLLESTQANCDYSGVSVKVSAVRARYEYLAGRWRGASAERRRSLIGELELLASQLPADDVDGADDVDVAEVRAAIHRLINEIEPGPAELS
jgi:hypothetical protein